jgi:hypothetical protein
MRPHETTHDLDYAMLGLALREARVSARGLAAKMGRSVNTILTREDGTRRVGFDEVLETANACNVPFLTLCAAFTASADDPAELGVSA